ncbi:hypothetical protein NC652_006211 [Populus alba x Populus x berolinensis]|nr:hypothetical protein NC652_006211 [Populus alba x Populus x berolinensis]
MAMGSDAPCTRRFFVVSLAGMGPMGPIKALCSTPRKHIFFSTVGGERERWRVLVVRGQVTVEGVRENVNERVEDQDLPSGFMSVHVPLRSGKCSIIGHISRLVIFVSSALFPSLYHDNV